MTFSQIHSVREPSDAASEKRCGVRTKGGVKGCGVMLFKLCFCFIVHSDLSRGTESGVACVAQNGRIGGEVVALLLYR